MSCFTTRAGGRCDAGERQRYIDFGRLRPDGQASQVWVDGRGPRDVLVVVVEVLGQIEGTRKDVGREWGCAALRCAGDG